MISIYDTAIRSLICRLWPMTYNICAAAAVGCLGNDLGDIQNETNRINNSIVNSEPGGLEYLRYYNGCVHNLLYHWIILFLLFKIFLSFPLPSCFHVWLIFVYSWFPYTAIRLGTGYGYPLMCALKWNTALTLGRMGGNYAPLRSYRLHDNSIPPILPIPNSWRHILLHGTYAWMLPLGSLIDDDGGDGWRRTSKTSLLGSVFYWPLPEYMLRSA